MHTRYSFSQISATVVSDFSKTSSGLFGQWRRRSQRKRENRWQIRLNETLAVSDRTLVERKPYMQTKGDFVCARPGVWNRKWKRAFCIRSCPRWFRVKSRQTPKLSWLSASYRPPRRWCLICLLRGLLTCSWEGSCVPCNVLWLCEIQWPQAASVKRSSVVCRVWDLLIAFFLLIGFVFSRYCHSGFCRKSSFSWGKMILTPKVVSRKRGYEAGNLSSRLVCAVAEWFIFSSWRYCSVKRQEQGNICRCCLFQIVNTCVWKKVTKISKENKMAQNYSASNSHCQVLCLVLWTKIQQE